jgi:HSP20 family protein
MNKVAEKPTVAEQPAQPLRAPGPIDEMESMLGDFLPRGWMRRWGWPSWGELTRPVERLAPRVNVIQRDDVVVLQAEIPGVSKDDLEISVTENSVTLKGTAEKEAKEEKGDYYRCEIARGAFARTVMLPEAIDTERAEGTFQDGMLTLTMPKLSKSVRRRIEL